MNRLYVNFEQYKRLCDRVIEHVIQSHWQPDHILGVSRGGLPLADALSRAFKKPMAVLAASSYIGEQGTQQGQLQVSASIATIYPLTGNVLLVDDLVDSGQTLEKLTQIVPTQCHQAIELRTAVIWTKPTTKFKPDYWVETLNEDCWVVQPFEWRDFEDTKKA